LEFDTPQALLLDANSQFSSLVEQTGAAEAEYLRSLANMGSSNGKSTEQRLNDDKNDELLSDNAETDPLIR
jgi:hypothetical protein